MCKTLLDLIATNKREEDKSKILYPTSEAKKNIDTQYGLDGFFEEARIPFNGNPLNYSPDPLEIGANYLDDLYDLNLTRPDIFEVRSVDFGDISVIDMPSISDVSEGFYRDIIPCNLYANPEYQFIGLEPCPPFEEQETDYLEYIRRVQSTSTIFDTLSIFNGLKTTDTKLGLIGSEALSDHFRRNLSNNAGQIASEYLQTSPFRLLQDGNPLRLPYDITVPKSAIGKVGLFLEKLTGSYVPFSFLPDDAFNINRKSQFSQSEQTKILLEYTGAGQKEALYTHLRTLENENGYTPTLQNEKGEFIVKDNQYVYIGSDAPEPFTNLSDFNAETVVLEDFEFVTDKLGTQIKRFKYKETVYDPIYGVNSIIKNETVPNLISSSEDFFYNEDETKNAPFNKNNIAAVWDATTENKFNSKSLLFKTKEIVNSTRNNKVGPFISSVEKDFDIIQNGKQVKISRGDAVTAKAGWFVDEGPANEAYIVSKGDFFRVFTKERKHTKLNRAISSRGLFRENSKLSVLGDNGLLNFAPTYRSSTGANLKNYMFSIENLAWEGFTNGLEDCEKGTGDLLSGHKGRVMWFPPYDLTFSESVSVNWETHSFIGRGENVYSYNNTDRSGSLSFTMIVDYPAVVNKLRGERNEIWERYFKGDKSVIDEISRLKRKKSNIDILDENRKKTTKPKVKITTEEVKEEKQKEEAKVEEAIIKKGSSVVLTFINIYFPNNVSNIPPRNGDLRENAGYQSKYQLAGLDYTYYKDVKRDKTTGLAYDNRTNYFLNDDFFNDQYINDKFKDVFDTARILENTYIYVDFFGSASQALPLDTTNYKLSYDRAANARLWFLKKLNEYKENNDLGDLASFIIINEPLAVSDKDSPNTGDNVPRGNKAAVEARRAEIVISYGNEEKPVEVEEDKTVDDIIDDDNLDQDNDLVDSEPIVIEDENSDLMDMLADIRECDVFEYLETYEPQHLKTISEKIKYFHPAFHSMTPEGFNSRLNFLHQCTRQSRNIGVDGVDNITNLAFGRPPVCILKIGDFYYSKILINSMDIQFEGNDGIKWDLNPEGFVAPMIAKITLNIVFIGGQSLQGPINRLQNALSFNFYSSMNMFDPRSSTIEYVESKSEKGEDTSRYKVIDRMPVKNDAEIDREKITDTEQLKTFNNIVQKKVVSALTSNNGQID
jgi:hypothetical protein